MGALIAFEDRTSDGMKTILPILNAVQNYTVCLVKLIFECSESVLHTTPSRFMLHKCMLFAGWEVRIVNNCDRGLENVWGHSFSLYGPNLAGK